jgi:molybdopterin biosynthesis enzyme
MLSVEAALEFLLSRARPLTETESVHLLNAGQRVLAGELRARLDVPPVNNSAMDGYAVRSAEVHADAWLPVVIFQYAMSPYENWQQLAWAGVFLITVAVLALNILARFITRQK